jgi:hypothetical protein
MEAGPQIILIGFYSKKLWLSYGRPDNRVWRLSYHKWVWAVAVWLKPDLVIKTHNNQINPKRRKKKKKR